MSIPDCFVIYMYISYASSSFFAYNLMKSGMLYLQYARVWNRFRKPKSFSDSNYQGAQTIAGH